MNTFGEMLKTFRQDAELTQQELAQLAGLGIETISALERGINIRPRSSTIQRLAEALQLTCDDRHLFEASARPRTHASKRVDNRTGITTPQSSEYYVEYSLSGERLSILDIENREMDKEYNKEILQRWVDDAMSGTRAGNSYANMSNRLENSSTVPLGASLPAPLSQRRGIAERVSDFLATGVGRGGLERKYRTIAVLVILPFILLILVPWLLSQFTGLPVAASAVGALQVVGGKRGLQSEGLHYTDTGGAYIVTGEILTATLSIKNTDPTASHAIALQVLDLSVRGPDACSQDWSAGLVDFSPNTNILLKPGEEYKYKEARSFDIPGIYFMEPTRLDKGGAKWGGIGPFPRVYFAVVDSRTGVWPTYSDKCLPLPLLMSVLGGR